MFLSFPGRPSVPWTENCWETGTERVLWACGVDGPAVSCDCRALDKVECLVQWALPLCWNSYIHGNWGILRSWFLTGGLSECPCTCSVQTGFFFPFRLNESAGLGLSEAGDPAWGQRLRKCSLSALCKGYVLDCVPHSSYVGAQPLVSEGTDCIWSEGL